MHKLNNLLSSLCRTDFFFNQVSCRWEVLNFFGHLWIENKFFTLGVVIRLEKQSSNLVHLWRTTRPDEWLWWEREEKTKQDKDSKERQSQFLWFGLVHSSHLAFLSKVLCEFFQLVQVLFIDCWLCVGQRPHHVRLKTQKTVLWSYDLKVRALIWIYNTV